MVTQDKYSDGMEYTPGTPYPALDAFRVDFPQVTTGVLYATYGSQVTVLGKNAGKSFSEKKFIEQRGYFFADPQFFSVFHFNWLSGKASVLAEPSNTVLTRKWRKNILAKWQDAIGQFIKLDNALTLKVAGILEDVPGNSDFPLGVVGSYEGFKKCRCLFLYN